MISNDFDVNFHINIQFLTFQSENRSPNKVTDKQNHSRIKKPGETKIEINNV